MGERITNGTYLRVDLPTEEELAVEMGVSYLTARRAVAQLVADGRLHRAPRGRLSLASDADRGHRMVQIAFAVITWNSFDVLRWYRALGQAAEAATRPVAITTACIHGWDDPLLARLAAQADGLVVYPGAWDASHLVTLMIHAHARMIAVDRDLSHHGLTSLCPCPPSGMDVLLDHLWRRGHRRIACVGAIPGNDVEYERAERYRAWCGVRGIPALRIASDRSSLAGFMQSPDRTTAVAAIAVADALATIRTARDHQVAVPDQLAVAVVNDEGLGDVLVPSLTTLAMPNLVDDLGRALAWMSGSTYPWGEKRCIQPSSPTIVARESA